MAFKCDICSKEFTREQDVLRHIRSKHRENKFECNVCNKKFSRKDTLTRHVKSLHKNIEFECEKCRKKFNRAELLNYHISICGKCRRYEVQFAALAGFAAHTCEAPAIKKRRLDDSPSHAVPVECPKAPSSSSTEAHSVSLPIPRKQSEKAGNSTKRKQYRRNWRYLEFVEGEGLEEDNEEMCAFLRTQWSSIRTFTRRGAVQDLYNFYYNTNYKDMVLNIILFTVKFRNP